MHLNMKLKRKQTLLGILKTIAYFAGYPLMVLFVAFGSVPFMKEGAFGGTWYLGIVIALIPWVICAILQIAFGCFTQNQGLKTIVVSVVATVCMLGCALAVDLNGKKVMDDMNDKYAATATVNADGRTTLTPKQVTVPTYRMGADGKVGTVTWTMSSTAVKFETIDYLKGHYLSLTKDYGSATDAYMSELSDFMRIYNVSLDGECKKTTADGKHVTNTDMSLAAIDPESGIPYNDNGVVSESYVYGVDFALNVLINYYEAVNKFDTLDVDMTTYVLQETGEADAAYRARIAAMSPQDKLECVYRHELERVINSDEYVAYQDSAEYKAAYGDNGSAKKFMLTVDRVKEILPVLVNYLTFILQYNELTGGGLYDILNAVAHLDDLKNTLNQEGYTAEDIYNWLSTSLGTLLPAELLATVQPLLTEERLEALLSDYVYYYSPSVRTPFDFFGEAKDGAGDLIGQFETVTGLGEDSRTLTFTAEEMRVFAYARYYAKTNGAFIGSVLVGNNDDGLGQLLNADGNIGQVTMSTSGYPASYAYTMDQIYQLKADKEYVPTLFPTLVARRYLYIFAGLVVLSIVLYYQFARRESEVIAALCVDSMKGGAK